MSDKRRSDNRNSTLYLLTPRSSKWTFPFRFDCQFQYTFLASHMSEQALSIIIADLILIKIFNDRAKYVGMLNGYFVTTVQRVVRFQLEETASRYR
jgi:hypothetical protein